MADLLTGDGQAQPVRLRGLGEARENAACEAQSLSCMPEREP